MKFSFSTKGWKNTSFDEFLDIAEFLEFDGIELYNIHSHIFEDKEGALYGMKAQ